MAIVVKYLDGKKCMQWPWCTHQYTIEACKAKVKELKKSGEYVDAFYRHTGRDFAGGEYQSYGRIYVIKECN